MTSPLVRLEGGSPWRSRASGRTAGEKTSAARASLDRFVVQLRQLPTASYLEIEGHTDASGPAPYNARLGLARAESVRRYLHEQHQLPLHKMSVISYGEDQPVASNDDREGRTKNRRVVVRVLG